MGKPSHIHKSWDSRVFVFGSNLKGIHGAGAALYARIHLGALQRIGEGRMNGSYALPTCSAPGVPLPLEEIKGHVDTFLAYAREHIDERFFVSAVGCGLAGYSEGLISPMFENAPPHCDLPPGWRHGDS